MVSFLSGICFIAGHDWVYPTGKKYRRCFLCDKLEKLPE